MENSKFNYNIRNLRHLDLIMCYRIDIHLALVEIILLIILRLTFSFFILLTCYRNDCLIGSLSYGIVDFALVLTFNFEKLHSSLNRILAKLIVPWKCQSYLKWVW